jgi:hypothetical protein
MSSRPNQSEQILAFLNTIAASKGASNQISNMPTVDQTQTPLDSIVSKNQSTGFHQVLEKLKLKQPEANTRQPQKTDAFSLLQFLKSKNESITATDDHSSINESKL